MNWVLIVVLVLLLFLFVKFKEVRHRAFIVFFIIVVLFLIVSWSQITKQYKVDLKSFDGVVFLGKLYLVWLKNVFNNLVHLSGNAFKQDWSLNVTGVK